MKLELLPRTDLAVRAIRLLSDGERRNAGVIAAATGSTPTYIPHVMSPLVDSGWVESARGPNGGYRINGSARSMSMLQLIEAVEGPTPTSQCVLRGTPCPAVELCALHEAWGQARQALQHELDAIRVIEEEPR